LTTSYYLSAENVYNKLPVFVFNNHPRHPLWSRHSRNYSYSISFTTQ